MNIEQLFPRKEANEIEEARMTPSEFEKGIGTGSVAGVLVGFEFETCMPKATMEQKPEGQEEADPDEWMKNVNIQWMVRRLGATRLFEDFEQVGNVIYKRNTYRNMESAFAGFANRSLRKKLDELYSETPQEAMADWESQKEERMEQIRNSGWALASDPLAVEMYGFARFANYNWRLPRSLRTRVENARRKFCVSTDYAIGYNYLTKFLTDVYGPAENMYELVHGGKLRVKPGQDVSYANPNRFRSNNNTYPKTADRLRPVMEQAFGNVQVFNRYHEGTKRLDTWYIEPDGSLRPNDGDGSAEIVSPPLLADNAMRDLAKFYKIAKQLNLYTNNSTGLHINVSIPKDIDVLKLAVFTGDKYVLQRFGRADNHYARSILDRLKDSSRAKKDFSNRGENEIYGQSTEEKINDIKSVAHQISGDHFSSVNFNGKYVSFRHAGGDYLADYRGIVETVGRFILAIQIAANPEAHKAEYIKKLVAMFGKSDVDSDRRDPREVYQVLRETGIPTVQFAFFKRHPVQMDEDVQRSTRSRIADITHSQSAYLSMSVEENSAAAQQFLNSHTQGFAPVTREAMANAPVESFVTVTIAPTDLKAFQQLFQFNGMLSRGNGTAEPFGVSGETPDGGHDRVLVGRPSAAIKADVGAPEFSALARNILKSISGSNTPKPNLPESR